MDKAWCCAYAVVPGTAHSADNTPCQDSALCEKILSSGDGEVVVGIACDGAGSAPRSDYGAGFISQFLLEQIQAFFEAHNLLQSLGRALLLEWLSLARTELEQQAFAEDLPLNAFACTLLVAVVGAECSIFAQIGDGAMVVSYCDEVDEYGWIFWPERGDYANVTNFVTQPDYAEHLRFDMDTRCIIEVAVFTDGLQHLALQYNTASAHTPLFRKLFGPLRTAPAAQAPALSQALRTYLNSPQINERTDDDKTLILATRWGATQDVDAL